LGRSPTCPRRASSRGRSAACMSSDRGRRVLQAHPDRVDNKVLRQFPEFLEFKSRRTRKASRIAVDASWSRPGGALPPSCASAHRMASEACARTPPNGTAPRLVGYAVPADDAADDIIADFTTPRLRSGRRLLWQRCRRVAHPERTGTWEGCTFVGEGGQISFPVSDTIGSPEAPQICFQAVPLPVSLLAYCPAPGDHLGTATDNIYTCRRIALRASDH
jgi:hypothetical protein